MSSEIVQVEQLSKHYGDFRALDHCNLSIEHGSVFGLLGPNGAGKTTLIRCLLGYLKPTSGSGHIAGFDCETQSLRIRQVVSYLPAESKLFRLMRGQECLDFFTDIHPHGDKKLAKQLSERLDLDLRRRVAFMSTGMRQKLAICCVMSCPGKLMILDEPTANLDPTVRSIVLQLVREAQQGGATVLFCSHVLSEIESICDRVAILRRGQVVKTAKLAELNHAHLLRAILPLEQNLEALPSGVRILERLADRITLELDEPLERHLGWIAKQPLVSVHIDSAGLSSLYQEFHAPEIRTAG